MSSKEKELIENAYQKLKDELNKANNLIDYFVVIGVPPQVFQKSWLYKSDLEELNTKYQKELEPKIISSFPDMVKDTISFDDSIINHCFPNGYKIVKSPEQPQPQIFSFILDNNMYNLNYPKKYLTCLLFYEKISQYKVLYDELQKIAPGSVEVIKDDTPGTENNPNLSPPNTDSVLNSTRSDTVLSQKSNKDDMIYIPKCLVVMSLYPYFGEYEKILSEIYNYSLEITYEPDRRETRKTFSEINIQQKDKSNQNKNKDKDKDKDKDYIIYKQIKNCEIKIPIDKMIENLVIEVPVPPRGLYRMGYSLNNQNRKLHQTEMNKLPYVDINLKNIFQNYKPLEIIDIYRHMFLETRLLFFSKEIELLNIYVSGFLSFLYPFDYQYQIVTILPKDNYEIIESITPFIAGINETYDDEFFDKYGLSLSDAICIIDIDNKKVNLISNSDEKIPDFPKSYKKQLEKNITTYYNSYVKKNEKLEKSNISKSRTTVVQNTKETPLDKALSTENISIEENQNISKEDDVKIPQDKFGNWNLDDQFNAEIGNIFFNFNAKLLSNYSKSLNLDCYSSNIAPTLPTLFQVEKYLKEFGSSDKDFYNKFLTETQIFGTFIFMRMIPKNSKEKIQILYFDEKINENSTNKPGIFTKSQDYTFSTDIVIQKPREITKDEKKYYNEMQHKKELLSYGIMIRNNNEGDIIFKYPIFPKLTSDIFFKKNITSVIEPMNVSDNINSINEDMILKSHLGGVKMRQNDMENYIRLCWIQMWGMTFWNVHEEEKRFRFQQLLDVIDKTSYHEMEIFNLIFEALVQNGTDYMILKLYDIITKLKLNPSLKAHNIVMKRLDKLEAGGGNIKENLEKYLERESKTSYKKSGFGKRTLKDKYHKNILTDNILFYAFDACMVMECSKEINLNVIGRDLKNMERDLIWAKCPYCKEKFLPKLTVKFGKEVNFNGDLKYNTSVSDCVILFSPLSLKENYNNSIVKTYGTKLNVDDLILKYNTLFWNSFWYFKMINLDLDFMLPYEVDNNIVKFNSKCYVTTDIVFSDIKNNPKDNDDILKYDKNELKISHFEYHC